MHPQLEKYGQISTQVARDSDLGSRILARWHDESQDLAKIIATAAGHLGVAILRFCESGCRLGLGGLWNSSPDS